MRTFRPRAKGESLTVGKWVQDRPVFAVIPRRAPLRPTTLACT